MSCIKATALTEPLVDIVPPQQVISDSAVIFVTVNEITNEQENKTELHFEIWKGYDKHDPSNWLYKAY